MRGEFTARAWLLIGLATLPCASPAQADESCSALAQAREAHRQLDYDKVTPLLEQALTQDCSADARAEIYELLALMHVTYNRDADARAAFVELLKLRPDYAPPEGSSPKIREAFAQAQADQPSPSREVPPAESTTMPTNPTDPISAKPEPATKTPRSAASATTSEETETPGWLLWTAVGTTAGAIVLTTAGLITWSLLQSSALESDFGPYPI